MASRRNYAQLCETMRNYAELCETMRNYAKLCKTMRNYAKLCETMRNYAKLCETIQNYAKLCETMRNYAKLNETTRFSQICRKLDTHFRTNVSICTRLRIESSLPELASGARGAGGARRNGVTERCSDPPCHTRRWPGLREFHKLPQINISSNGSLVEAKKPH